MSRIAEGPQPTDLAEELARRSTAITALVTLRDRAGATIGDLGGVDEVSREALRADLCWLAATGLLRREPHGSWDVIAATGAYRLSSMGRALADALNALAEGYRHLAGAPTIQRHDSIPR
ncbi:hypothetical protein EEZ25_31660 [Micromonospora aurantiaca]|uniref:hypothetical protein n=1 Tax=Micromonospora aurantiaca (nom. illeg.) TaxID=47850 RepID=UPI000F408775|nr:hypothetical protein [Micromonospora aurantiaca]RNH94181.1 hypothetical protein EEZ25_31660 [Micromonospora aurantiaca]